MICIFDLDGTLLDTVGDIAAAVNFALTQKGFPTHTPQNMVPFLGNGTQKLLERALPPGLQTAENVEILRPLYQAYYNEHLTVFTKPYPAVTKMLDTLHARGIELAVASNKYHSAVVQIVKYCFPTVPFAAVLGQREGYPTKPNPQIVQEILEVCAQSPSACLYIGDSDVDMQTARNAGVKVGGVTWGYKPREVLAAYKPDFLADHPDAILEFVNTFSKTV